MTKLKAPCTTVAAWLVLSLVFALGISQVKANATRPQAWQDALALPNQLPCFNIMGPFRVVHPERPNAVLVKPCVEPVFVFAPLDMAAPAPAKGFRLCTMLKQRVKPTGDAEYLILQCGDEPPLALVTVEFDFKEATK
jgi:hypothetical protein